MRKLSIFVLFVLVLLSSAGCSSFGVWSPQGQQDLTKVAAYYNQYVAGAVQEAPAIIAEASTLLGSDNKTVREASTALTVAQSAVSDLNRAIQVGTATNTQTANVQAAIDAVNQTMGAVKAVTAPPASGGE